MGAMSVNAMVVKKVKTMHFIFKKPQKFHSSQLDFLFKNLPFQSSQCNKQPTAVAPTKKITSERNLLSPSQH